MFPQALIHTLSDGGGGSIGSGLAGDIFINILTINHTPGPANKTRGAASLRDLLSATASLLPVLRGAEVGTHTLMPSKLPLPYLKTPQKSYRTSVGDPDPHVFGPTRSGFISQRYGSFPFLIKVLRGLKYC